MFASIWEQYKPPLAISDWGADLATFCTMAIFLKPQKIPLNIHMCVCVSFIDFSSVYWPFVPLDLTDSSLSQLCKHTHLLCMLVLRFSPDTLQVSSNQPPFGHAQTHTHAHTHYPHQSSLKTPMVQGLLLKQSGAFYARSRARCSHGDSDLNNAKGGTRRRKKEWEKENNKAFSSHAGWRKKSWKK